MLKRSIFTGDFYKQGKALFQKALKYAGVVCGAIILIFIFIIVFFPDPFINTYLKDRIVKGIRNAYPAYTIKPGEMHYNIWRNSLGFDSISVEANDSTFSGSTVSFSVSGINWIKTILNGGISFSNLANAEINAENITIKLNQQQKELRLGKLHLSMPDSLLTVDSLKYYSLIDDEKIFAKSIYGQTRFHFDILRVKIIGLDCPSLLKGDAYSARGIFIDDLFADILANMDKPCDKNSANPQMPNEILSSINESIKIDSVKIAKGRLKYSERYRIGAAPGVINIENVNVSIIGIANHSAEPDTAFINGEGLFMDSGKMKLSIAIPLTSKVFSLKYSGSLGQMDVTALNSFIVPCEYHRIKSGSIQSAYFNINVNSGYASGTLSAIYKDLSIAVLNEETGSEKGIFDRIASFFGKIFVIRGSNIPDEAGKMNLGEIKYQRKPDDQFIQFLWFALRGGVADLAGFPRE